MRPVPGRFCIGMVPGREEGSLRGHTFHFPAGSYTLSKHHCLYGMDFLTRDNLYAAFHPIGAGWLRHGYRGGLADVQPRIGTVRFLPYHVAGHCLFSSLAFYVMEHGPNPLVKGYGDALWWAFMDVTTVGSNIIAVTPTGRVLSVLLAALGMMMFPIFTVYVTSLVERRNKEKKSSTRKLHRSPRPKPTLPE